MMKRRLAIGVCLVSTLLFLSVSLPLLSPASAAVESGHSADIFFTSSQTPFLGKSLSFTNDVEVITAWISVSSFGGAEEKSFEAEIVFVDPQGVSHPSRWVSGPKITSSSGMTPDSRAGKYVEVADGPLSLLTGLWDVYFYLDGFLHAVGHFELKGESPASIQIQSVPIEENQDAWDYLEGKGYNVYDIGQSKNATAYAVMDMAADELYTTAISMQLFDTCRALEADFPSAEGLMANLIYDTRYDLALYLERDTWESYAAGEVEWDDLAAGVEISVWDNDEGRWLKSGQETEGFLLKMFGRGTLPDPFELPEGAEAAAMAAFSSAYNVSVVADRMAVPADGISRAGLTVTLYDSDMNPLADENVGIDMYGTTGGSVLPRFGLTDENGQLKAAYRAGRGDGFVSITATAGDKSATVVILVGEGIAAKDSTSSKKVYDELTGYGYVVHGVGYTPYAPGKLAGDAVVEMEMDSVTIDAETHTQVLRGWRSLEKSYLATERLYVALSGGNGGTGGEYTFFWKTGTSALRQALAGETDSTTFWDGVYKELVVIDNETGEEVPANTFLPSKK